MLDLAAAYLEGGVRFLQMRGKRLSGGLMLATASALVDLARPYQADIVINDRADIARLAGAAGVHVGQDDLSPALVRALVGDTALVGVSTHTPEQLTAALAKPVSYVAVGPIFDTATKSTGYESVGLEAVRLAARQSGPAGPPIVAIGGITLDNAASVLEAGASSVAVISDLLSGGDPERRARAYIERLSRSEPPRV
jgi:thiamine-phosphate pyrophosphorylase